MYIGQRIRKMYANATIATQRITAPVPHRHPTLQSSAPAYMRKTRQALVTWAAFAMLNAGAQDAGAPLVA